MLALCAGSAAWSQPSTSTDPVIVTATRVPQPLSTVLADVSVLNRDDITRSGAVDLADLLARLPGVAFTRNGGPGSTTGVFIRGSESRHTALFIDGVRVDSQTVGGAVWEQVALEQIDRIEVLRGPAAAFYGSDAVGGVVQLFTRRGDGPLRPSAALTLGSQRTAQAQAGLAGASGPFDVSLSGSVGRSSGFNARPDPASNPDLDGWRRSALQARVGWQADARQRVYASLLASRVRAQYDGSDQDDVSLHTLRTASLGWQGRWSDAATSRVHVGESHSTYESQPFFYRTETSVRDLTLQHEQRLGSSAATPQMSLLAERREDRLLNPATDFTTELAGKRSQNGVALGLRSDLGDHGLQAQLRHDDDSEFGGHTTGSMAWGWRFAPHWRASASAATSFRAPTLYQRFSEYGVAALVPEKGRNVELGLRWGDTAQQASLHLFRNNVSDLINFGDAGPCASPFGCYANVGRARYEGASLAGNTALGATRLRASLDWQKPRDLDTGLQLARRARKAAKVGVDVPWSGWWFGSELLATGARFDNAANTVVLSRYTLVNLSAARELWPGLRLEGRIDNVTNRAYETARGYATQGRAAQVSLRWTPQ